MTMLPRPRWGFGGNGGCTFDWDAWAQGLKQRLMQRVRERRVAESVLPMMPCGECGHALHRHHLMPPEGLCADCKCGGWAP